MKRKLLLLLILFHATLTMLAQGAGKVSGRDIAITDLFMLTGEWRRSPVVMAELGGDTLVAARSAEHGGDTLRNDRLTTATLPENNSDSLFQTTIKLREVTVKGRKLVPRNSRNFMPDRGFGEGDPVFETTPTLELLVSRLGLKAGTVKIDLEDGNGEQWIRCINRNGKATEVRLDNEKVTDFALQEILLIHPSDIAQMEYFLPSNYEFFGNLSGGVKNGMGIGTSIKQLYGEATAGGGLLYIYTKSRRKTPRRINTSPSLISVAVQPEGGTLLAGHWQRVAYKVVDKDGNDVDAKVKLVNANGGKVVCKELSEHEGMGSIFFTPELDEHYIFEAYAKDGSVCRTMVPDALSVGVTMTVNQRSGMLFVTPIIAGVDPSILSLVISSADKSVTVDNLTSEPITVDCSTLSKGMVSIAIVNDSTDEVYAERPAYVH